MIEQFIGFAIFIVLLLVGLFVGRWTERSHFQSLQERERDLADFLVTDLKSYPSFVPGQVQPTMVIAEAVIATDYLKSFLAKLKNIFGGEVRSYQSLLIRARREATVRLVEQARELGCNAICNVRYDTADVGGNSTMKQVAMVAILASATAYRTG